MQPWEMRDLEAAHYRLAAFVCARLGHDLSDVQRVGDPVKVGVIHASRQCRNCHKSFKVRSTTEVKEES